MLEWLTIGISVFCVVVLAQIYMVFANHLATNFEFTLQEIQQDHVLICLLQ